MKEFSVKVGARGRVCGVCDKKSFGACNEMQKGDGIIIGHFCMHQGNENNFLEIFKAVYC